MVLPTETPDAAAASGEAVPARRTDLIVSAQGDGGAVVKVPATGAYYQLGPEETFLLKELDGRKTTDDLCDLFRQEFSSPLTPNDLQEFVEMARAQQLLAPPGSKLPSGGEQVVPLTPAPVPAPPPRRSRAFSTGARTCSTRIDCSTASSR